MHTSITYVLLMQESHTQYMLILIPLITLCHSARIFQSKFTFFDPECSRWNGKFKRRFMIALCALNYCPSSYWWCPGFGFVFQRLPCIEVQCECYDESNLCELHCQACKSRVVIDWQHRRNNLCLTCRVIISLMLNVFERLNVSILTAVITI